MFGFLAQLLAWCFDLVPNYAAAIALFTLIVMAAITPFTVKGMRSAAEMARIQPELKKLQDQYKNDKVKQNEEVQALFKEHGVNPLGGCLPMLLPFPIFFIIFRLLRGMNGRHTGVFAPLVRVLRHQVGGSAGYVSPHYLTYKSSLTQHIIASNGVMKSFGMDLAATARGHHATVGEAIPFYALIVLMTVSQYWQQRQINQRNPAAANANPQMKLTMQIFPAFYALISLSIPASVVLYLFLSGLFRMAQNAASYRWDPVLARAAVPPDGAVIEAKARPAAAAVGNGTPARNGSGRATATAKAPTKAPATAPAGPKKGLFASFREAAEQARNAQSTTAGKDTGAPVRRTGRLNPAPPASPPPTPPAASPSGDAPSTPSDPSRSPLSVRPSGRVTPPGGGGGKRSKKRG